MNKNNIINTSAFIVSPVISLPGIFYGIYKKNNFTIGLLVVFLGILSFLYVPHINNDRARYFEMYFTFQGFNFRDFIIYLGLTNRPDFILHLIIYVFAKVGISVQFLFFGITSITAGIWFYVYKVLIDKNKLSNGFYFLGFVLILFSFSLPHLLSGIRFYLGSSFVLLGLTFGLFERRIIKGVVFLILASLIHYSTTIFIPLYFLLLIKRPYNQLIYKTVFILSFVFFLLPKDILVSFVDLFELSGGYANKVDVYINNEDFIERGIKEGSSNYIFIHLFSIAWSFFAYIYLILTIKRKSEIRNLVYLLFGITNVFFLIPNIYSRYLIILRVLFALLLISELDSKALKPALITLGLFFISFISEVIILRLNIVTSYFNWYFLSGFFVFFKEITPQDFLI